MKKRLLIINVMLVMLINSVITNSYADNLIDDPTLLYSLPLPEDSSLTQKITVNHKFNSINDFAARLNAITNINAIVKDQSANIPIPVTVVLNNGTILQLLKENSKKFGYSWSLDNAKIIFSALNPRQKLNLQSISPNKVNQNVAVEPTVWNLNPKDRMLRNALTKWCKASGWQLIWNINADFPIVSSWHIQGTFENAVNEVLKASQTTNIPLLATMHDENKVLEIYSANISK